MLHPRPAASFIGFGSLQTPLVGTYMQSLLSQICCFAFLLMTCLPTALGEPIDAKRVETLPPKEHQAWVEYVFQSKSLAQVDADALQAEVTAAGMTKAFRAPDGGDFKLSKKPGDPWYASDEAKQLAEIILSYQTPSGGWSKHTAYSDGPRKPGMQWSSQHEPGHSPHYQATFDNRSTTEQLHYLANVWQATGDKSCMEGFVKGLVFVLSAQYPNGGWPQVYPLEGGYHDNITFNDDAMTHILELLLAIEKNEPRFKFLDPKLQEMVKESLDRGIQCVLKTQVVIDGKKTVWCAQHDPFTLEPAQARKMEPATLSGVESARLLKFLMTIPEPSPELTESIESGLAWMENAQIAGLRRSKVDGKTAYLDDPSSSDIYWARFYDINSGKPVFPGKNGKLYDTFAAMAAENELGYDFYSTLPESIVANGQKKWRKMLAKAPKK
jgi:PelA/Pel-15E family pectate lyase